MSNYANVNYNHSMSGPIFTVDPDATWDGTLGYRPGSMIFNATNGTAWVCVDSTPSAARWVAMDVNDHPGYVSGRFYVPAQTAGPGAGSANGANVIRCLMGVIKRRVTIAELGFNVTAAAGTFGSVAIYRVNPVTMMPSTLIDSTAAGLSTAGIAAVSGALNANQTLDPGWYAFCSNFDGAPTVVCTVATQTPASATLGSATQINVIKNVSQTNGFIISSKTFGTWPPDLTGSTFAEGSTNIPLISFKVA